MIEKYDKFVRDTLAEEGISSPSEDEEEDAKATDNPALVMVDESTGNRYMRIIDQKGVGSKKEMEWLVRDVHSELRAWGHPCGMGNRLILKCDVQKVSKHVPKLS